MDTEIRLAHTDREINQLLKSAESGPLTASRHFNQSEEFFIRMEREVRVPSFPIHHDVRTPEPTPLYRGRLAEFLHAVVSLAPQVFSGLTYYFDPTDILHPGFFQLFRIGEAHYLYLVKVDMTYKVHDHTVEVPGTNDFTAQYRTRQLFAEGIVVPVAEVRTVENRPASFLVKQMISQTWIGETGRGYFVQGIWIDHELTKFFSKLFLPRGKKTYPYFPFQCRYRTLCRTVIDMDSEGRKKPPQALHRALQFIGPHIDTIQEAMRNADFSEDLPAFATLKEQVPAGWNNLWNDVHVRAYLNENDMKEYVVETHA